jgi:hypothetical protein
MLPYETISDALLDSAEQVGLNIWQSEEQLDPQTLTRTFTLNCLAPGEATLRTSSIQAALTFKWDAAMTAISTMGTEAICEKYHSDDASCSHTLMGCAYEATLTLEISYTIPLHVTLDRDVDIVVRLAHLVQELHRSMVDHHNPVAIDANMRLEDGTMQLIDLKAQQRWMIGNQLHDLDDLQDVFEEACNEVRDMLLALVDRFTYPGRMDADDHLPLSLPIDDNDDERIYLRPSTA